VLLQRWDWQEKISIQTECLPMNYTHLKIDIEGNISRIAGSSVGRHAYFKSGHAHCEIHGREIRTGIGSYIVNGFQPFTSRMSLRTD
jgi:hypothetical protein